MNILILMFACFASSNLIFGKLCASVFTDTKGSLRAATCIGLLSTIIATLSALLLVLLESSFSEALILMFAAILVLVLVQLAYLAMKNKHENLDKLLPAAAIGSLMLCIMSFTSKGFDGGVVGTFCTGIGYTLALLLMTAVRERLTYSKIPTCMKGLPISLVTAGLMTLAYMGFVGLA